MSKQYKTKFKVKEVVREGRGRSDTLLGIVLEDVMGREVSCQCEGFSVYTLTEGIFDLPGNPSLT